MNGVAAKGQLIHVGAIIPFRLGSTRLPRKPLADVAGVTALERVADRARRCRHVQKVVIATTTDSADDELASFAEQRGLAIYRGSVQDVLERIWQAAREHDFDVVVEVDGDDLLCAPEYMDQGVEYLVENNADFVSYTGLPLGATPNILRTTALERAVRDKPHQDTSTGFFRYLEQSGAFHVVKLPVGDPAQRHAKVRMTLDYPEDLEFFRAVYAILDRPGHDGSLAELVALLNARPDLVDINQGLDEAYRAHFDAGLRGS